MNWKSKGKSVPSILEGVMVSNEQISLCLRTVLKLCLIYYTKGQRDDENENFQQSSHILIFEDS